MFNNRDSNKYIYLVLFETVINQRKHGWSTDCLRHIGLFLYRKLFCNKNSYLTHHRSSIFQFSSSNSHISWIIYLKGIN